MASRKTEGRMKRKARYGRTGRTTTNVFSQFKQEQIQEMKEAFEMIDQNRDGIVDKQDLHVMLASLGHEPSDSQIETMLAELPCPMNFTLFLAMFGDRLQGTDPEDTIRNAFSAFDEQGTGTIDAGLVREMLTSMGEQRLTDDDVDAIFRDVPGTAEGLFNYMEFTRTIKYGIKEQSADQGRVETLTTEPEILPTITEL
ncbi:myosin regulatory light chain 12B-like [Paramacrobiotus metropolitanus]|uniref:myosin regulatory light chain 12B-like n=1 Tax=Paramacrobiotus metropolitanus TaxID=2943436 RepID=UPI002445935C|nr:myosin regulatory light chain 12B-like [Paramacrobiotus metropolitanus]XP_055333432.1 myosin regulatory light chain 12B-like [Paramacrobiotus metropolitanus]